jgi:hypothetical protein
MIDRFTVLCLAGRILLAVALPFEFGSGLSETVVPEKPSSKSVEAPAVQNDRPAISQLTATILARPLFSPTRRPPEAAGTDNSGTPLSDLRLTGILITPDQRLAIFSPAGGKPLVRSEGDMVSDWRIDSIASQSVSLTGPTGATTLEPKADPNLVRATGAQQAMAPPPQPAVQNPQMMVPANAPVRAPIPNRRSSR